MRLAYNEIAARLGLSALESDFALTAAVTDSREAASGALFVCIPGSRVDGHDFVPAAVELGASAVLASRALPDAGVPVLVVEDTVTGVQAGIAAGATVWGYYPADQGHASSEQLLEAGASCVFGHMEELPAMFDAVRRATASQITDDGFDHVMG